MRKQIASLMVSAAMSIAFINCSYAMTSSEAHELAKKAYYGDSDALKQLESGMNNGDSNSFVWLVKYYVAKKKYESMCHTIRKFSRTGNAVGEYYMGAAIVANPPKDCSSRTGQPSSNATKWFRLAAEKGYLPAENQMGVIYYDGDNLEREKNYTKAVYWYKNAAKAGYRLAEFNLGVCYFHGRGVEKNYSKADYWLNKVVDGGGELANDAKTIINSEKSRNKKSLEKSVRDLSAMSPYSVKGDVFDVKLAKVVQIIGYNLCLMDSGGVLFVSEFSSSQPGKGEFISGSAVGVGAYKYESVNREIKVVPKLRFVKYKILNMLNKNDQGEIARDIRRQILSLN